MPRILARQVPVPDVAGGYGLPALGAEGPFYKGTYFYYTT